MPEEPQTQPEPIAPIEAHPAPVEAQRPPIVVAERGAPEMRLGEYVQTFIRAERGDARARQRIEAQLDLGTTVTSPGVVPTIYVQQIIDSLGADRPLDGAMSHADMPAAGMTIRRPHITTRPDGGWVVDETTGAPTGPVVIGNSDQPVDQWAWGGSASVALVERSAPSYVEEVFQQAIKSYYRDVEAKIAAEFSTAASTVTSLGGAVAAYLAAYRTYPNLIVCGSTAYGLLLDARGVPLFMSGSADAAGNANIAGLAVVASADVAAADAWVTSRDFLEIRETTPVRLSVANVEALSMEIGVTAFYSQTQTREALGGVDGAVRIPAWDPKDVDVAATSRGRKSE
jgi:hypothetical protein